MKYCPNCRTNYTDDTLQFCLQDGTPLAEVSDSRVSDSGAVDTPTVAFDDAETIAASRQVEQIHVPVQKPTLDSWEQSWETRGSSASLPPPPPPQPVARKTNTGVIVALTALLTLLLLGGAAWFFMKNRTTEVAANVNTSPKTNRSLNTNSATNQESDNQDSNANALVPAASPTATPAPKPKLKPEEAQNIVADVGNVIDDWKEASENLDIDRHLSDYAKTVDYYKAGRIGQARVRADKQKAFEDFDSINFNISNLKITPGDSGEKATAVFDKEWTFEGAEKNSSGKVRQLLTLDKIGGEWKITGEKDLKVYYVNK